jgi:hypothetical protein
MLSRLAELYDGYLSFRDTWFDPLFFLAVMINVC